MAWRDTHRLSSLAVLLAAVCAGSLALSTASARAAEPCPNEAIRLVQSYGSRLPDCRAYEQVSPLDKGLIDAQGEPGSMESSPSGESVSYQSLEPFPGVSSAPINVFYLSTRRGGEEEWDTQGLLPALGVEAAGKNPRVAGFGEDLSQAVIETLNTPLLDPEKPAGEPGVYLRDSATGSYRPLAVGAEVEFAGATPDGSQVLFETEKDLLPGLAAAGVVNLYDWDEGRLSVPGILPVSEGGKAPAGGSVAGSQPHGGSREDTQNLISADGSRVFFSDAGTGQLYAREDPGSVSATTVHVSASEKMNGAGSGGGDIDGEQPATLQAATPDGSQVFFTSPEELTNDANTGPPPGVGRANLDGSSAQPGFVPTTAKGIAVNSEYVYWANPKENSIGRARIDGTEIDRNFITGVSNPQYVALCGEYLYWTDAAQEKEKEGAIARAKIGAGGAEAVEQKFIAGASDPQGIAINSEYIYWANVLTAKPSKSTIARAKVDGEGVELTGFVTKTETPGGVALNSEYIYWAIPSSNEIGRAPIAGGKGTPGFITGASEPQGVAVNSEYVYWANSHTGTIAHAPIGGGAGEAPLVTGLTAPWGVALDGAHVYWASGGGDEGDDFYRYDFASGSGAALTDLTPDSVDPDGADVLGVLGVSEDGSYVYFVANGVLAGNEGADGSRAAFGTCERTNEGMFTGGTCNLYVRHGEETTFIATLDGRDGRDVDPAWDVGVFGTSGHLFKSSRVDPSGTALLFTSVEKLTGYDNAGHDEVYLYRAASASTPATLRCVACNRDGVAASAEAYVNAYTYNELGEGEGGFLYENVHLPRNLSENGGRVFFETEEALQTENGEVSANGEMNVYEWEEAGEGTCPAGKSEGCVYLISSGQSTSKSYFADASANGDDVFFFTRQQLVAQDDDENADLYDARVDGGIPLQNPAPSAPPCEGESGCRAASPGPLPVFGAPSSSTGSGPGNLTPPPESKPAGAVKGAKAKKPTRAQELSNALKACERQYSHSQRKRRACEAHARKLYAPKHAKHGPKKSKKRNGRSK